MDIMKTLVDQYGGQIIEGLAGNLGLGTKEAENSIAGILPAIMGGLINKVGSDSGATELFDVVDKADGGILENLSSAFSGGSLLKTGLTLLPMIFGGQSKTGMVADLAGRLFGIGGKSRSVLGMLAPVVLSFLGRQVKAKAMGKQGFVDMLLGQKEQVKKAAHPEMASLLGFSNWGGGQTHSTESHSSGSRRETVETTSRHVEEEKKGGGMGFLKFLLPLLLLGALAWFLMRSCGGGATTPDINKGKATGGDKAKSQTEQTTNRNNSTTRTTDRSGTQAGKTTTTTNNGATAAGTAAGKVDSKAGTVTGGDAGAKVEAGTSGGNFSGKAGELAKGKSGTIVNFGNVSDGKVLTSEAKATFDQVAEVMKANPDMKIDIRAHAKDHGNIAENTSARAACKFRAGLVQAYLKLKGVALNRVKSSSVGKKEPMSGVDPKDDKQKRIEIKIQ